MFVKQDNDSSSSSLALALSIDHKDNDEFHKKVWQNTRLSRDLSLQEEN